MHVKNKHILVIILIVGSIIFTKHYFAPAMKTKIINMGDYDEKEIKQTIKTAIEYWGKETIESNFTELRIFLYDEDNKYEAQKEISSYLKRSVSVDKRDGYGTTNKDKAVIYLNMESISEKSESYPALLTSILFHEMGHIYYNHSGDVELEVSRDSFLGRLYMGSSSDNAKMHKILNVIPNVKRDSIINSKIAEDYPDLIIELIQLQAEIIKQGGFESKSDKVHILIDGFVSKYFLDLLNIVSPKIDDELVDDCSEQLNYLIDLVTEKLNLNENDVNLKELNIKDYSEEELVKEFDRIMLLIT